MRRPGHRPPRTRSLLLAILTLALAAAGWTAHGTGGAGDLALGPNVGLLGRVGPGGPARVQAQSIPQAYAWVETRTVDPPALEELPRRPVSEMAPYELALADDGRLFVVDDVSHDALVFGPDGSERERIRAEDLPPDFRLPQCDAGVRLASVEMDHGGRAQDRPETLLLNWFCLAHTRPGERMALSILRSGIEARPHGRTEGRSLHNALQPQPRGLVAIDVSTGHLIYPINNQLVWMDRERSAMVRRSRYVSRYLTKVASLEHAEARHVELDGSSRARVRVYDHAEDVLAVLDTAGSVALALDASADGRIYTLVRPYRRSGDVSPFDPEEPIVRAFDTLGQPLRDWSARELDIPHPPASNWPWHIAVSSAGFAFTSQVGGHFVVAAFDLEGRERFRLLGVEASGAAELLVPEPIAAGLRLDGAPGGALHLLDRASSTVMTWDRTGSLSSAQRAPAGGIDLAAAADHQYLSTSGSQVYASTLGQPLRSVVPSDYPAEHGEIGGRIAAGAGRLFVGWHDRRQVAVLDPERARIVSTIGLPDAPGLWPADVAAGPDGALYTANLVEGSVERWSTALTPTLEHRFRAGFLYGPWRIAHGRLADGSEGIALLTLDGFVELHEAATGAPAGRFAPELPGGVSIEAEDLALDDQGRVFLADVDAARVHVFAPAGPAPSATPSPTTNPSAPPTRTPRVPQCELEGDKRVTGPRRIVLGQTTELQLTLRADCPPRSLVDGADIVIIIDRSGSMQGINFEGVRNAVQALLQFVDSRYHRVAIVSFASDARIDHWLTHDTAALYPIIGRMVQGGGTSASGSIALADEHLRKQGRPDALPIVIFLSDGNFADDPRTAAAGVRGRGVQVFAVGYGANIDRTNLMRVAGLASRYREAPDPAALIRVYRDLIREVQLSIKGSIVIDDLMGPRIDFVSGSARPVALEQPGALQWGLPILPRGGVTLTYSIKPTGLGILPTNLWASARLTADGGIRETFTFPIPEIEVIAPSPTPTPTDTPTPTHTATATPSPTPSVYHAYLPLTVRERCDPATLANDVVLVLDASTSMLDRGADGRTKMEAARAAVRLFLDLLDLEEAGGGAGRDRAAIVGFNAEATLAHPLGRDRAALDQALAGITNAPSTRIDLGLQVAHDELEGPRRRAGAGRVIVLLTDGRANPVPIEVAELRALEAKAAGITIFTIGLGQEVEAAALARIASRPQDYFAAPGPEDLDAIYRQIARSLPCPSESFWGRR